jgi:hypothetical protein
MLLAAFSLPSRGLRPPTLVYVRSGPAAPGLRYPACAGSVTRAAASGRETGPAARAPLPPWSVMSGVFDAAMRFPSSPLSRLAIYARSRRRWRSPAPLRSTPSASDRDRANVPVGHVVTLPAGPLPAFRSATWSVVRRTCHGPCFVLSRFAGSGTSRASCSVVGDVERS